MEFDKITKTSLLYDFYGALLSERQRQVTELYFGENYTLAEISSDLGISRQAVHDALKNGQKALDTYETKLGLVEKFIKTAEAVDKIDAQIDMMMNNLSNGDGSIDTEAFAKKLEKIKLIIDNLED